MHRQKWVGISNWLTITMVIGALLFSVPAYGIKPVIIKGDPITDNLDDPGSQTMPTPVPTVVPTVSYTSLFARDPGALTGEQFEPGMPPAVNVAALYKDNLKIDNVYSRASINNVTIDMTPKNDTVVGSYLCRTRTGRMKDLVSSMPRGTASLTTCQDRSANATTSDFVANFSFKPGASSPVTLFSDQRGLGVISSASAAGVPALGTTVCSPPPLACVYTPDKKIIDVAVLYTPETVAAESNLLPAQRDAAVVAEIVNEIADVNQAFCNSNISAWMRLVHVSKTESQVVNGASLDFQHLLPEFATISANPGEPGLFDEIAGISAETGSDLQFLYVADNAQTSNSCGLTTGRSAAGVMNSGKSFAVMNQRCIGRFNAAELSGHLLGLDHSLDTTVTPNVPEADQDTGPSAMNASARGYRGRDTARILENDGKYGTIMTSASGVTILPVYSTTDVTVSARCSGIKLGTSGIADSAAALNSLAVTVDRSGTQSAATGTISAAGKYKSAKYRDFYFVDLNCQGTDCIDTNAELLACYNTTAACAYRTFKTVGAAISASIFVPGRFLDANKNRWIYESPNRLQPSLYAPPNIHYLQDGPADIGDLVMVAPGIYHERIGIRESNVTVRSIAGPGATTIDARHDPLNGNRPAKRSSFSGIPVIQLWGLRNSTIESATQVPSNVSLDQMKVYHPTIEGFTITGGYGRNYAGGIACFGEAAPKIIGNIIIDNSSHSGFGGGVSLMGCGGELSGNVIARNKIDGQCHGLDNLPGAISNPRNLNDWCNVFVGRDNDPTTLEAYAQRDLNGNGIFDASEGMVAVSNTMSPQNFADWEFSFVGKEFAPVVGVAPNSTSTVPQFRLYKPAQHMVGGAGVYISNICPWRKKAEWRDALENICADSSVTGELVVSNNLIYDNEIKNNVNQPYFDYENISRSLDSGEIMYQGTIKTNGVVDLANNAPAGAGILVDGLMNRDLFSSGDGYSSADDSAPTAPGGNSLVVKLVNNTLTNNRYNGAASNVSGAGLACRSLSGVQLRVVNTIATGNYAGAITNAAQNVSCNYVTSSPSSLVIGDGSANTSAAEIFATDPTVQPRPAAAVAALDPYAFAQNNFGLLPVTAAACNNGLKASRVVDQGLCEVVVAGNSISTPIDDIAGRSEYSYTYTNENTFNCENVGRERKDIGALEYLANTGCSNG
ncbi:MAG: hypothetical protein K1X83_10215 [Oligoflexia bacterium]|nr:hypothetical protein [Oligoflexia bacterium]